ncbi:hypothetical protein [Sorangium sp. So ce1024]|uniref:hypothetical protein n=1 Tax=unclassified Sorangium TaxID=2621164 RepID=UPI003F0B2E97
MLTSPCVARRHEGLGRVLGGLALLAAMGPFLVESLVFVFADALHVPFLRDVVLVVLGALLGGVLVAALLALLSAVLTSRPVSRREQVRVAADASGLGLTIGAAVRFIPRAEIRSGLLLPEPRTRVALHLRHGQVLEVEVAREIDGARLLEALGIGPAERRVAIALGGANRQLVAGCAALPLAIAFWFTVVWAFLGPAGGHAGGHAARAAALLALPLLSVWLIRRAARPTRVVVGSDGVRVERSFSSAWLPYKELAAIRRSGDRLILSRASGDHPLVVRGGKDLIKATARRIRDAHRRAGAGATGVDAPRGAEALERRGRDLAVWREDLRKLHAAGDYRASALTPEDVLRTLDDAGAPRDRRVGAALFLRVAGYPEAQARIRVAAGATADDALRAALERAAEEEIDDASLARALR